VSQVHSSGSFFGRDTPSADPAALLFLGPWFHSPAALAILSSIIFNIALIAACPVFFTSEGVGLELLMSSDRAELSCVSAALSTSPPCAISFSSFGQRVGEGPWVLLTNVGGETRIIVDIEIGDVMTFVTPFCDN
jgi:hypothetical protein